MNSWKRPDFTEAGGLKPQQQIKRGKICEQSQKDGLIHKAVGGDRDSLCWAGRLHCRSLKTQISANPRFFKPKDGWNDAPGMVRWKRRGVWGYCGINYKLLVIVKWNLMMERLDVALRSGSWRIIILIKLTQHMHDSHFTETLRWLLNQGWINSAFKVWKYCSDYIGLE